jgi:hypothetical protein
MKTLLAVLLLFTSTLAMAQMQGGKLNCVIIAI